MLHRFKRRRKTAQKEHETLKPSPGYCCIQFEGLLQEAGRRGFGAFAFVDTDGERRFILQHRALDPGKNAPPTDSPLSLFTDAHIFYCPWCGAALPLFYQNMPPSFDKPDLKIVL